MNKESPETYTREKIIWMVTVPQLAILLISILWIYFTPHDNVAKYFHFGFRPVLFGVLTGILLSGFGYGFYWFSKKTKMFYETVELFEVLMAPAFKNLKPPDMVLLSLVSGFCEEIFFRGLLLPRFGIIISSTAFGLLHLPGFKFWIYMLWATLSGALFGVLFLITKSLWLPICAHAVNNMIGMFLLTRLKR